MVLDLGGCAARDWDPWCLVYLPTRLEGFLLFFFSFFFPISFLFSLVPLEDVFSFSLLSHLTSCYTFLKTSMIKTQLNPGAPVPLLASIGPLSIEACCEVALALNKAHSQWKLGRICDPPRHGHGHGPARPGPTHEFTTNSHGQRINAPEHVSLFSSALCVLPSGLVHSLTSRLE